MANQQSLLRRKAGQARREQHGMVFWRKSPGPVYGESASSVALHHDRCSAQR